MDLGKVVGYFVEFLCGVFCVFSAFDRVLVPLFRDFKFDQMTPEACVYTLIACLVPVAFVKLIGQALH